MKKKVFNLLLVTLFLTSCQPDWKTIFQEDTSFDVYVCVPIISDGKDSITVCNSLGWFYDFQNMKLMSEKEFYSELHRYIEIKECVEVDSALYNKLYRYHVKVDSAMLQIYKKNGINELLNKYAKKDSGEFYFYLFDNSVNQFNLDYLLYLCSLHHIYFELRTCEEGQYLFLWHKK